MMSFASSPAKISCLMREGSTRHESDWVQGMCTKWCRNTSGPGPAHELWQRVQVVVVHHHHRLELVLDLLHHGSREVLVDRVVAELECLDLLAADVRCVGQVPQVVLDEPQHRVGEHVVEAVIGLGVADHQTHLILPAGGERTGNGRAPCSRETCASCSFIAEAIQTASRCEARPVSAVTSPPEPRCTSPPGPKVTGPRLLTSTSGERCAGPVLMPVVALSLEPHARSS